MHDPHLHGGRVTDGTLMPQTNDIRQRLGVRPLINLTGTLTAYGGISARPEAIEAAAAIMGRGVDIVELQACASRIIAEATGAEAGFVAACSSAGICMAIAGAMTGSDLALIERLPDAAGMRSGVAIQTGHLVNYGHSIGQDIRQTGARVVAIGDANAARTHQLQAALGPDTAAALYVVSHHCAPYGQIPFAEFVRLCHEHEVPVIVDLAAEYDLTGYLRQGADVTIHSSHKFLGGATAGIVAGRKDLVRAAYLQNFGIGRPMKAGKESVASALVALQGWGARDHDAERRAARQQLEYWRGRFERCAGITATLDPDPTGNPFERLKVTVGPPAGLSAVELVHRLETGEPPIAVRAHQVALGWFVMDPRSLADDELEIVADRVCAVLDAARRGSGAGPGQGDLQRWQAAKSERLRAWPDLDGPGGLQG